MYSIDLINIKPKHIEDTIGNNYGEFLDYMKDNVSKYAQDAVDDTYEIKDGVLHADGIDVLFCDGVGLRRYLH